MNKGRWFANIPIEFAGSPEAKAEVHLQMTNVDIEMRGLKIQVKSGKLVWMSCRITVDVETFTPKMSGFGAFYDVSNLEVPYDRAKQAIDLHLNTLHSIALHLARLYWKGVQPEWIMDEIQMRERSINMTEKRINDACDMIRQFTLDLEKHKQAKLDAEWRLRKLLEERNGSH